MSLIGQIITPSVSNLNTREYFSHKSVFNTVKSDILGADDCSLCLTGCDKDLPVFAFLANEADEYKNDFSSFIFREPKGGTTVGKLIKLNQDGTKTVYAMNSAVGTEYPSGTLKTSVYGFILSWYKVADVYGFGKYQIQWTNTLVSGRSTLDKTTPCYNLKPYTCEAAHRTVRFTTQIKGYIQNGFDYRDLTVQTTLPSGKIEITDLWPQQLRWYGRMIADIPTFEEDTISDRNYKTRQIQSRIYDNYSVRLEHIQTIISKPFLRNQFLANEIYLDDYNRNNQEVYKNVRVNPIEITDRTTFALNKNEFWTLTFEEYDKGTIKRN